MPLVQHYLINPFLLHPQIQYQNLKFIKHIEILQHMQPLCFPVALIRDKCRNCPKC